MDRARDGLGVSTQDDRTKGNELSAVDERSAISSSNLLKLYSPVLSLMIAKTSIWSRSQRLLPIPPCHCVIHQPMK